MSVTYYQLLGHISLAVHSSDAHNHVREALKRVGIEEDQTNRGRKLAEQGEALIVRRVEEVFEDRVIEHGLHYAIDELEMWMQTVKFRFQQASIEEELVEHAFDHSIHAHEHALTSIMHALRLMAMIRTHSAIYDGLGSPQSTHDLLVRGLTLLQKALGIAQIRLSPGASSGSHEVFDAIQAHQAQMLNWLSTLEQATQKLSDAPEVLGLLGYVPSGIGLPLGGASFAVVLHEEAKRLPPDPSQAAPTSGWSIGRQGRNRENLGKGFLEPTFE